MSGEGALHVSSVTPLLLVLCFGLVILGVLTLALYTVRTRKGSVRFSGELRAGPLSARGDLAVSQHADEVDRLTFETAKWSDFYSHQIEGGELEESEVDPEETGGPPAS
jgi:hypothetical protein